MVAFKAVPKADFDDKSKPRSSGFEASASLFVRYSETSPFQLCFFEK